MVDLSKLITEQRNEKTMKLDEMNTMEILQTINEEDKKVADGVQTVLSEIALAVEKIVEALKNGGRLFYIGAGTSGRVGVMDAAECPPTFLTSPNLVQPIMAGGKEAFIQATEFSEDDEQQGRRDLETKNITNQDVVIGITASGRTPYPIGALKLAKEKGAFTISLTCNPNSQISLFADLPIEVIVGPEVLTGSTRLKAATAHKMILNMISTTVMIKLGKVYENLMVDVHASNEKLVERARRIIMDITKVSYEQACEVLVQANNEVKPAIVMIEANVSLQQAKEAIHQKNGYVKEAISLLKGE